MEYKSIVRKIRKILKAILIPIEMQKTAIVTYKTNKIS